MLVKPSGKLVIAKDNAKSIRSMSAMFIARWHSARSFWGAPAATTTCRDGYHGRLPAAVEWVSEVSPCQSSRVARMTPSPQWGNSEWTGGMYDDPADGAGAASASRLIVPTCERSRSCCSRLLGFRMGVRSCRVLVRSDVHLIADLSIVSHPQLRSTFLVCDRISISIQPCTGKQFAPAAAPCL